MVVGKTGLKTQLLEFGMRIDLELYVRVEKNWRNKEQKIREFGLDELNEGTR